MASHGGGGGIESAAPHPGPFSTLAAIGLFCSIIWLVVSHPRVASKCVIAAGFFAAISGGGPLQHPLIGIIAIIVGLCLAGGKDK